MNFVPAANVQLNDPFWTRQVNLVREVVLPYMWDILNDQVDGAEKSHCVANFQIAAGRVSDEFYGPVFIDTDLYKWIEAVAYTLSADRSTRLEEICDQAIDLIAAAQQPDGYLNTYYTVKAPEKRWTNLMEGHELYTAGHLMEASVAYYQATGKDRLLNVACRFADLIFNTFGKGKKRGYPGHPEVELALIRLYQATNKEKYLHLARYFVNERGTGENIFEAERASRGNEYLFPDMAHFKADYFQAHLPVMEQCSAAGHSVRAMYLYSAMADLARLTNDTPMAQACTRLYQNTIARQMYVTGGVGSARLGERFTCDYDLPSDSAYAETCASIGLMLFSTRMWQLTGQKACYDIWEQALYNTVLSGMGRDGKHFFYVNPLEVNPEIVSANPGLDHVATQRQKWFGVACCPPNLARILTSLRGSIYAHSPEGLYVLTHIGSSLQEGGLYVNLIREGGRYTLTINAQPMDVFLRLPENSRLADGSYQVDERGYFLIHHPGGERQYSYTLSPEVRILRAHPRVSALSGKVCVQRGLVTYCAEGKDHTVPLSTLRLSADAQFEEVRADWLDEEFPALQTSGYSVSEEAWENLLYNSRASVYRPEEIRLIPYSQWGNRGEIEMRVWINEK